MNPEKIFVREEGEGHSMWMNQRQQRCRNQSYTGLALCSSNLSVHVCGVCVCACVCACVWCVCVHVCMRACVRA